jgi:hypothetical protein
LYLQRTTYFVLQIICVHRLEAFSLDPSPYPQGISNLRISPVSNPTNHRLSDSELQSTGLFQPIPLCIGVKQLWSGVKTQQMFSFWSCNAQVYKTCPSLYRCNSFRIGIRCSTPPGSRTVICKFTQNLSLCMGVTAFWGMLKHLAWVLDTIDTTE